MTKSRSNAVAPAAKGQLVVGTGTDASTTLAVASTAGYLLSVDSAETTGLKWAAPAGGLTVIATGTLSGTSVVISTIPGTYKHLMLSVFGVTWDTASSKLALRYNSVTNNYGTSVYTHSGTTAYNNGQTAASAWGLYDTPWLRTGGLNHANFTIYDYTNTTGIPNGIATFSYKDENSVFARGNVAFNNQATAVAITSLTIKMDDNYNMTAGTYTLYGVS